MAIFGSEFLEQHAWSAMKHPIFFQAVSKHVGTVISGGSADRTFYELEMLRLQQFLNQENDYFLQNLICI